MNMINEKNEKGNWGYLGNGQRIWIPDVPYLKADLVASKEETEEMNRTERMVNKNYGRTKTAESR